MVKEKQTKVPQPAKSRAKPRKSPENPAAGTSGNPPVNLSYISPGLRDLARPCDSLAFHPHNPRKHSDEQIARIAASLRTKGQCKNIVASTRTEPPTVICGNGTLRAALSLNWSHIAVELKKMTEAEENALAVLDNRLSEESNWDTEELALALGDMQLDGDERLEQLMEELRKTTMADHQTPNESPETPENAKNNVCPKCGRPLE